MQFGKLPKEEIIKNLLILWALLFSMGLLGNSGICFYFSMFPAICILILIGLKN